MSECCELCRSIRLRPPTLPSQPTETGNKYSTPFLDWFNPELQSASPQIYHHYPSFQLLRESANGGCPLCGLFAQSLLNADVYLDIGTAYWGGIFLLWYRTSIQFESSISKGEKKQVQPVQSTKRYPGVWDKIEVRADMARLGPLRLTTMTLPDNAAAPYIMGRPPPAFDSDATYQAIKDLIGTCCQHHSSIRCPRRTNEILPTRIIDVGLSKDSVVSLYVSANTPGTYLALSHVWGASIHTKLKEEVIEDWKKSIDVSTLSRSFQDAIIVTRRLGFRYIWIDALCIIQESLEDWHQEVSRMGDVYRKAFLTIAISATSQDPEGFLTRKPNYNKSCELELELNDGTSCGQVWVKPQAKSKGEIDTRAWCLQERLLSTRLLTFTPEEFFFECQEQCQVSESGAYSLEDSRCFEAGSRLMESLSQAAKELQIPTSLGQQTYDGIRRSITRYWYGMIGDANDRFTGSGYANRRLSQTSDKLPALSGLAHEVHKVIQSEYLAGIWACNLVEGLLWQRVLPVDSQTFSSSSRIPRRNGDPRAPSWSWAASNGPVRYMDLDLPHNEVDIVNAGTNLTGNDSMGGVSAGWINLNGPILEISCIREERPRKECLCYLVPSPGSENIGDPFSDTVDIIKQINIERTRMGAAKIPENFITDVIFDELDGFSSSVTCLLFSKPSAKEPGAWARGLILQKTGIDNTYRRLGFWVRETDSLDLTSFWETFNRRTITLI